MRPGKSRSSGTENELVKGTPRGAARRGAARVRRQQFSWGKKRLLCNQVKGRRPTRARGSEVVVLLERCEHTTFELLRPPSGSSTIGSNENSHVPGGDWQLIRERQSIAMRRTCRFFAEAEQLSRRDRERKFSEISN